MNCQDVNQICDKNQYKEAGLFEKIKLTIHLIYCKTCKKYSSRNKKLTDTLVKCNIKTVPKEDKNAMKDKLQQELTS